MRSYAKFNKYPLCIFGHPPHTPGVSAAVCSLGRHGCTGEAAQHARDLGQARRVASGPDASHVHTTAE